MAIQGVPKVKKVKNKKTKPRKSRRSEVMGDLESTCSKICSKNAGGLCEICKKAGTQAHHIFSKKAFPFLRFNIDNLIWLCFFCHIRRVHQQAQYELARDALVKRVGLRTFDKLKEAAYKRYVNTEIKKMKIGDLDELLMNLRQALGHNQQNN
jgi:hypothetical protein